MQTIAVYFAKAKTHPTPFYFLCVCHFALDDGFTKKYAVHTLVYFETSNDVTVALQREKHLKDGEEN